MTAVADASVCISDFLTKSIASSQIGTLDVGINDSVTSIVLTVAGFTALDAGPHLILIDSELIEVIGITTTLLVTSNGRGYMGTTAVSHSTAAVVKRANLTDILGSSLDVYHGLLPTDLDNSTPAISYVFQQGGTRYSQFTRDTRVQIKCYGGKNAEGRMLSMAASHVYHGLIERLELADRGHAVDSGFVYYADEEGEGALQYEPDTDPKWPYILSFVDMGFRFN